MASKASGKTREGKLATRTFAQQTAVTHAEAARAQVMAVVDDHRLQSRHDIQSLRARVTFLEGRVHELSLTRWERIRRWWRRWVLGQGELLRKAER